MPFSTKEKAGHSQQPCKLLIKLLGACSIWCLHQHGHISMEMLMPIGMSNIRRVRLWF